MSVFYLVRHGQASFGSANYDALSDLGFQQARWLGHYFAEREWVFDLVIAGNLQRHQQTAQALLEGYQHTLPLETHHQANEFDFENVVRAFLSVNPQQKPAANAPRSEFYRLLKNAMLMWSENKLPAGMLTETWADFEHRTNELLAILQEHYGKRILVVSSGGAISMMIGQILELQAQQRIDINLQIMNTAFSQFYFNKSRTKLATFNNVPHLDLPERRDAITFS